MSFLDAVAQQPRPLGELQKGVVRIFAFTPGIDGYVDLGTGVRPVSFGDDGGQYPNDGECEDPRFVGSGMADPEYVRDVSRMHDATDCRALFETGAAQLAEGASTGTGFVVAQGGFVVTNFHVVADIVDGGYTGLIWETDTGAEPRMIPFEIVDYSRTRDLALLQAASMSADRTPLEVIDFASIAVEKTYPVQAVGFPGISDGFGSGLDFSSDWTNGQIQDVIAVPCEPLVEVDDGCPDGTRDVIQHGADISGGNSGGPLTDLCGNVLGVNSFGTGADAVLESGGARRLFAVSSSELIPLLREAAVPFSLADSYCKGGISESGSLGNALAAGFASALLLLFVAIARLWRQLRALNPDAKVGEIMRQEFSRRVRRDSRDVRANVASRCRVIAGRAELKLLRHELGDAPATIGSDARCEIVVGDDLVSARHARVGWDETAAKFWLEDLSSLNGTFLADGSRLAPAQRCWLEDGDRFYLVHANLGFYVLTPA